MKPSSDRAALNAASSHILPLKEFPEDAGGSVPSRLTPLPSPPLPPNIISALHLYQTQVGLDPTGDGTPDLRLLLSQLRSLPGQ